MTAPRQRTGGGTPIRLTHRQRLQLLEMHEQLRRVLHPEQVEAERLQRIAAAAEAKRRRDLERERRRQKRIEAKRAAEAAAAARRRCRICSTPLRKDAAPSTHWCTNCLRTVRDACPDCGQPKTLDRRYCRRCHPAHHGIERTNLGQCHHIRLAFRRGWMARPGCAVQWGNLDHQHCSCGRPMSADPDVERCGRCVVRELEQDDDGHCQLCGLWLGPLGKPRMDWEPDYSDPPPGRVCDGCQGDLNRIIGAATGRLRALLHSERVHSETREVTFDAQFYA